MGVSGLIGLVMGRLTDRYNARIVIAVGTLIGTVSYVLLSTIGSLWQFYLYFGLGAGSYVGGTYTPVNAIVSKWFKAKRTLAIGITLMGITIGQMVLSPVIARVISASGWRTAYLILAVVAFVCALPAIVLISRKPPVAQMYEVAPLPGVEAGSGPLPSKDPPPRLPGMTVREASKTAPFVMLLVTGLAIGFGYYTFASHVVPYATDRGMSTTAAALVLTVCSVGGMAGTLLAWGITVKLGNRYALVSVIALQALATYLFVLTRDAWAFYLVALLLGFSFSAASPTRMGMVAPLFGLRSVGAILGFAALSFSVGGIAGPFLAGYIFDARGSYSLAFIVAGALLSVGALVTYLWGSHRRGE